MTFGGVSALSRGTFKPMAAAAIALTMLSLPANAATIRVGSFNYEIAFYGLGGDYASIVSDEASPDNTPPIQGTPWFTRDTVEENENLATRLANGLTAENFAPLLNGSESAYIRFAYAADDTDVSYVEAFFATGADSPSFFVFPSATVAQADDLSGDSTTYAYAASVTQVPLPPAGLALGVALFGLLGLRRRKGRAAA